MLLRNSSLCRGRARQVPADDFERGSDVPDPYYGGAAGFQRNHDQVLTALTTWLDER